MILGNALWSLLAMVAHLCACLGVGSLVWRLCRFPKTDRALVLYASQYLLGFGILAAIFTILGLVGLLTSFPTLGVILLGLGFFALGILKGHMPQPEVSWPVREWGAIWHLMIALSVTALFIGLGLGAWLIPPFGDAEAYYLVYPKIIAATGIIEAMHGPYGFFSTVGITGEVQFAALMVLADQWAAKLMMFPIAVAGGVFLASIVRSAGGGQIAQTLSWAIFGSSTTVSTYVFDGKVELVAIAFGLAAVFWLFRGFHAQLDRRDAILAGLFGGLATVTKFSLIPTLGLSTAVLLIWRIWAAAEPNGHSVRPAKVVIFAKVAAVMTVFALVAWLPQLLKNGVVFGAPLAPFLGMPEGAAILDQTWFSPEVTRHILATYPIALVFGRYPMQGGGLSPLVLALVPLAILLRPKWAYLRSPSGILLVAGCVAVIFWMIFRPSVFAPRYFLVSLLLVIPATVMVAERVLLSETGGRFLRWGVTFTAVLAIAAAFWPLRSLPALMVNRLSPQPDLCAGASVYCPPLQELARVGETGARIFMAGYYAYHLRPDQLQCRDSDAESRAIWSQDDPIAWLQERGFRYVFVDLASHTALAPILRAASLDQTGSSLLQETAAFEVYEIAAIDASRAGCGLDGRSRWYVTEQ